MSKRRWTWVAPGVGIAMAAIARLTPLRNADLLWQIRSGDEVVRQRARLTVDHFSMAFRGRPIRDHEAALEVFLSMVNRAGGLFAIWWSNLVLVAIGVASAVYLAGRMLERDAKIARPSMVPQLLALSLVLPLISQRLELRAELVTLGAVAIAYVLRRAGGDSPSIFRRFAPVLVAALAAPFHALAWWIAVVPGVFFLERVLQRDRRRERLRIDLLLEAAAAVVCVLAAELTSPGLIALNFSSLRGAAIIEHITELQSPMALLVSGRTTLPMLAILVSLIATLGLVRLSAEGRARPSDALLMVAFMLPGLRYARFAPAALIASLPCALAGVGYFTEAIAKARLAVVRAAIAAVVLAVAVIFLTRELGLVEVQGFDFSVQPVAAVEWLRAERADAVLFHPYNFGAYLIFVGYPPRGVLIDPRAQTLYPDDYVRRYYDACGDAAKFEQWAAEARFDTVLLASRHKGTQRLREYLLQAPGWTKVYDDEIAIVFERPAR